MTLLEASIIYLSIGAPFGAHYLVKREKRDLEAIGWSIVITAAWIFYLFLVCIRFVKTRLRNEDFRPLAVQASFDEKVRKITSELESLCKSSEINEGHHERRLAVERYAGLAFVLRNNGEGGNHSAEQLASICNHNAPELLSSVLARTNNRMLESHHSQSLDELLSEFDELDTKVGDKEKLSELLLSLFRLTDEDGEPGPLRKHQLSRQSMQQDKELQKWQLRKPIKRPRALPLNFRRIIPGPIGKQD